MCLLALGCEALTPWVCQSFPSSGTHRAEATAGKATGTRLLDMGKQAPETQANTSPDISWGPALPGQKKVLAMVKNSYFLSYAKTFSKDTLLFTGLTKLLIYGFTHASLIPKVQSYLCKYFPTA